MRGRENDGDRRQSGGEQEGHSACQGTVGRFFAVDPDDLEKKRIAYLYLSLN